MKLWISILSPTLLNLSSTKKTYIFVLLGQCLPWQFFSSTGLKVAKMEGIKGNGFLRKCSSGYPDLGYQDMYYEDTSRSNIFLQNFGRVEFGCSIGSSLSSASCRLQFSPESGGAFVSRIQKEGAGESAVNRPTSRFPLQSMTAKTLPTSWRGLNGSLSFATKIYNMQPTFTGTACPSLGTLFVACWI